MMGLNISKTGMRIAFFDASFITSCKGCLAISHVASTSIHQMSDGAKAIAVKSSSVWYASATMLADAVILVMTGRKKRNFDM